MKTSNSTSDPLPSSLPSELETQRLQHAVQLLLESNQAKDEQFRQLMERVGQMSGASALPLTMGVATPVSMHSRPRMGMTPFGTRFGAADGVSGVRRPLFVPPPVVRVAPPAPTVAPPSQGYPVDPSLSAGNTMTPTASRDPPPPKVDAPSKFKGTMGERDKADEWWLLVLNWLRIAGKNQPEDMLVLMIGSVLAGEAHTWYTVLQQTAMAQQIPLTVQYVSDVFLSTYVGGTTRMMKQLELSSLTYGEGRCVDVVSTQTEFERLASSLYPGASLEPQADELLATAFADIYKRGDFKLWEKAVEMNPVTLDEWKAAVQRAFIIRRTVVEGRKAIQRMASSMASAGSRGFSRPTQSSFAGARVQQMETYMTDEEDDDEEGKEGEPGVAAGQIQQMGTTNGKRGMTGARGRKWTPGPRLLSTPAERQKLMQKGKCFHCFKPGHRVAECPDVEKPARRPTAEELNL